MAKEDKPKRRYHRFTKEEKKRVISLLKRPELLISDIIELTGLTKDTIRKINVQAGYIRKPESSKRIASENKEKKFDSLNGPVIVFDSGSNSFWKFTTLTEAALYFKKAQPSTKSQESNIDNVRNSIRKACRGAKEHKLYGLYFYFYNECDDDFKKAIDEGLNSAKKKAIPTYNVNAKKTFKEVPVSLGSVKDLGKNRSKENLDYLLELFNKDFDIVIKREIVSSIGRQEDLNRIYKFISQEAFKNHPMELSYQMYRTCLYKQKIDQRFHELGERIRNYYRNEVLEAMKEYKEHQKKDRNINNKHVIKKPLLLIGDSESTLKSLPECSIQLIFTSPPYYNAKEYADYHSYNEYLEKMKGVLIACHRVLEEGRFIIINVAPVQFKRPGREFQNIKYPLHYDFHKILTEAGFEYIDEIQWIKPEPSVPMRNGNYLQMQKPLTYRPNCINEIIMVYRKKCDFLLAENISDYPTWEKDEDETIDISNCWYINPTSDKVHPAVFPKELCKKVLKYYSFKGDVVLDPFAGVGTLGEVALDMKRIPVMCEIKEEYTDEIVKRQKGVYEIKKS